MNLDLHQRYELFDIIQWGPGFSKNQNKMRTHNLKAVVVTFTELVQTVVYSLTVNVKCSVNNVSNVTRRDQRL